MEDGSERKLDRRTLLKGAAAAAAIPIAAACVGNQGTSGGSPTPAAKTSAGATATPAKLSGNLNIL